jgi:hypothetical protein
MATAPVSSSPLCRHEEGPFLLLESTFHAVQDILVRRRGQPLRHSWLDRPYGEEDIPPSWRKKCSQPSRAALLALVSWMSKSSPRWRSCPNASSKLSASKSPS